MANTLTATYNASLALALYKDKLPSKPTSFDFSTVTIDTGVTIATHTSGTFKRVVSTVAGQTLEFELADTGTGKTWVQDILADNLLSWTIDCTAE